MEGKTRDILVWSANDYLAMGTDPVVIEASIEAARRNGAGAGGTRNIAGSSPLHVALEEELADLHGKDAALLFTSGFVSNQASLERHPAFAAELACVLGRAEPQFHDRRHQGRPQSHRPYFQA